MSLCPKVYELYDVKLIVAMVQAGCVQGIIYLTVGNHRESVSTGVYMLSSWLLLWH